MIYLLGGSGYVGQAYQALLTRKGLPFRNLRRADVDYTNPTVLRAALLRDKPEFLINAAGYTGKTCEIDIDENKGLAAKYGVSAIPNVKFMNKNLTVVHEFLGYGGPEGVYKEMETAKSKS